MSGADALLVFGGQGLEQPDLLTLLPLPTDDEVCPLSLPQQTAQGRLSTGGLGVFCFDDHYGGEKSVQLYGTHEDWQATGDDLQLCTDWSIGYDSVLRYGSACIMNEAVSLLCNARHL